jgi:hypothetical protein
MPIRKRNLSRRSSLDSNAQAWLRGDESGFFMFKPIEELETLWNEYGDESMFWRRILAHPISRKELAAHEGAWLNSGTDDEYGMCSFFINQCYDDDEKQSLWASCGNHEAFHWKPSMRRPEPIEKA